jgi:hypothetical protein
MITFYGDCSLSTKFMRESGDYYGSNKERIDYEIKNASKVKNNNFDNLFKLARIYNCDETEKEYFAQQIVNQKNAVFGLNFENTPKVVMSNIQQIIDNDIKLKKSCSKIQTAQ